MMMMLVESMYSNNSKSYQVNVLESLAHIIPEVSIIMQLKSYSRLILFKSNKPDSLPLPVMPSGAFDGRRPAERGGTW